MFNLWQNTLWNFFGFGFPLLVAVFAIPYLLGALGNESFGVLTLIWSLIGYFSLFDFGIGRALSFEISRRWPAKPKELAPFVRAGIALTCATGIFGALIVAVLVKPLSSGWLKIGSSLQYDAIFSFSIATAGIIPTTITSGLRGILEGFNRFSVSNINRIFVGISMFGLPVWSVYAHGNQLWIATLYMVIGRFIFTLSILYQLRRLIFFSCNLKRTHFTSLVSYGVWITVSGIIGPLMVYGDRFFVSAAVGAEFLPHYAIPQEALQRLLVIPSAICGALLPQIAALPSKRAEVLYRKNFRRVTLLMFGLCSAVALLSYPGMSIWISPEFAHNALPVTLILTTGILLNAIAMVPLTVIHAMGKPKITAIFHMIELSVYALLLWILAKKFGLIGAAIAWTSRVAIDLALLKIASEKILIDAQ